MDWGERTKEIMQERGLKQKDLAEKLGVSQSAVSLILQGDVRLSTLEKIAFTLGVPIAELLERPQKAVKQKSTMKKYRETHVHGYIRIGNRIVEVNSLPELKDAVTACEVNNLR